MTNLQRIAQEAERHKTRSGTDDTTLDLIARLARKVDAQNQRIVAILEGFAETQGVNLRTFQAIADYLERSGPND